MKPMSKGLNQNRVKEKIEEILEMMRYERNVERSKGIKVRLRQG